VCDDDDRASEEVLGGAEVLAVIDASDWLLRSLRLKHGMASNSLSQIGSLDSSPTVGSGCEVCDV